MFVRSCPGRWQLLEVFRESLAAGRHAPGDGWGGLGAAPLLRRPGVSVRGRACSPPAARGGGGANQRGAGRGRRAGGGGTRWCRRVRSAWCAAAAGASAVPELCSPPTPSKWHGGRGCRDRGVLLSSGRGSARRCPRGLRLPRGARASWAGVTAFPPRRYLLYASGDFVKVHSVNTEETLRLLCGHADLVTGIQLNPHNHMQVCGGRSSWGWAGCP